jgi:drug/metabolite transporter (DMT)-like permease
MHTPITASLPDPVATVVLDHLLKKDEPQSPGGSIHQWSSLIGIITAIVGNLLISFALNTQRYAHILIDREYSQLRKSSANGHPAPKRDGGYGTHQQEAIAEGRRKQNLEISGFQKILDEETGEPLHQSSDKTLQPGFEPRKQVNGQEKDSDDDSGKASYLKSPYWWLGLVLMIIGEAGNFLAYGFAPASIVSPLGVVALISNCLIAPLMLKERFRRRDLCGVLVAIAGAVVVVLSARHTETKFGPGELWRTIKRWEFLLYVIITAVFVVGLMYIEPRYCRKTILVDLGLVALFGAYTALSTKGVSSLLSASLYKAFTFSIFYFLVLVLVGSALMQIRYLNRALQNYDSTQVIPTQFVLFTLSVIIGSAVLYRDFEHTTGDQAVKFVIGCLLTFFGVYLITSQRHEIGDVEDEGGDEVESIRLLDEEAHDIDERTPLTRDPAQLAAAAVGEQPTVDDLDEEQAGPVTPRRRSVVSSEVPSISVTPAESSDSLIRNPWLSSTEEVDAPPPRTPRHSEFRHDAAPLFFPATSNPLQRTSSSPADPQTPTKPPVSPRPPSPDRSARRNPEDPSPSPSFLSRSARGSISRLIPIPGPLLAPLSNSLSALVADSIMKGEGAPRSVRAALRRTRSARHSTDDRRRTVAVPKDVDYDDPLAALRGHWNERNQSTESAQDLSRSRTHETVPSTVHEDNEGDVAKDMGQRKTRLRALSETLSGMMGHGRRTRSNGKDRDDDQDHPDDPRNTNRTDDPSQH